MTRRRDSAWLSLYTLVVVVVELAWLGLIGYVVLRLLQARFPELPR